jgi:hypothetical protein
MECQHLIIAWQKQALGPQQKFSSESKHVARMVVKKSPETTYPHGNLPRVRHSKLPPRQQLFMRLNSPSRASLDLVEPSRLRAMG